MEHKKSRLRSNLASLMWQCLNLWLSKKRKRLLYSIKDTAFMYASLLIPLVLSCFPVLLVPIPKLRVFPLVSFLFLLTSKALYLKEAGIQFPLDLYLYDQNSPFKTFCSLISFPNKYNNVRGCRDGEFN